MKTLVEKNNDYEEEVDYLKRKAESNCLKRRYINNGGKRKKHFTKAR